MRRLIACCATPMALTAALLAAAPSAHADDASGDAAHDALPGLSRLGVPAPLERGFVFAASGSYGYTGDVLGDADAHHRAGGTLAFSYRPRDWIGLALRLDGRHDAHSGSVDGKDDGWIGDTRLVVRLVAPSSGPLGYGGSLTFWFPSSKAFQPEGDAISFDAEGWLGWRAAPHLGLVAGAGVRVDRSAHSAPADADLLSRADRLALGVGEGTDLLVGAGAFWRVAPATTTYLEWSWDVPVAGDARPKALEAPMRADLGLRYRLAGGPTLEASAELELSKRPDLMADVPLAPIEPRFSMLVAATWSFGGAPARATGTTTTDETVVSAPPPAVQTVRGRLTTPTGEPLAGVRVHIGAREAVTGADGSFELDGVPAGEAQLEADVPLPWAKISTTVVVGGGAPLALGDVPVTRALPPGQIRGVVRTLTGKPIAADVTLLPLGQKVVTGAQGEFRVDVPPGEYDVLVEAPGFTAQKRHVVVDENGVTVLNIDLRTARPGQGQDR